MLIRRWLRRASGLAPAHSGSEPEVEWVAMRDGVRLHTLHIWPIDLAESAPTIVLRTPHALGFGAASPLVVGRLIAESGYHVVLQDVRGRHTSEGHFTPFASEQEDGGDTLVWIASQHWCDGRIGLFGRGYAGYCAWAALADAPQHVSAMAIANCARDPYALLHPGGALALELALGWAVAVGDREAPNAEQIDLKRGLEFRPVREADRVASRIVDWYRDWVDHPARDAYWQALTPALPDAPPPSLLVTRWNDPYADALRADYTALRARGSNTSRLMLGDWPTHFDASPLLRRRGMLRDVLREAIEHFDHHLRHERHVGQANSESSGAAVRYFDVGESRWHASDTWPPSGVEVRPLHLRALRDAGTALDWEAPGDDERPDQLHFDPADPVQFGEPPDANQGGEVVAYESGALGTALHLSGEVTLRLYLSCDREDADVTARLLARDESGETRLLCSGVARARWRAVQLESAEEPRFLEPDRVVRIEVALGACAARLSAGHRLRLELAGSDFPRIDRSSGGRIDPSAVTPEQASASTLSIQHDVEHPSHVRLPTLPS